MLKNKTFIAFALVIVSTVVATLSFYLWQVAKSPNLNLDAEEDFELLIPAEANYETILDSLRKHDIIHDEIAFGFLTRFMEYRESIKPGRYLIPPNSGNKEIISKLRSGKQDALKVIFNNIRTKQELIEKLGSKFEFNTDELYKLLNDPEYTKSLGFTTENIMGMFLPDTYFMYWNLSPKEFMNRFKDEYDKFWTTEKKNKAKEAGMTTTEVGIMASIVQSETNKTDEMPRVAGVYVNRIKQGIPLQADPTVKFAVGDFTLKRVLNEHLRTPSPYNTYIYQGLPPGPIALPEKKAIIAVLNQEKHEYIYFCAREDFSGYHTFATNYSEHMINARKYHKALNEKGIK